MNQQALPVLNELTDDEVDQMARTAGINGTAALMAAFDGYEETGVHGFASAVWGVQEDDPAVDDIDTEAGDPTSDMNGVTSQLGGEAVTDFLKPVKGVVPRRRLFGVR